MSKYERVKPKRSELEPAYAGKHVWNIAIESLGRALYVGMDRGVILPAQSFGGLYEDKGGVLSVSNDKDQHFWRAVHTALMREDATISCYMPIMSSFFRSYKYKHEFIGRDRSKMLEVFYPGVHDDPADYLFISDELEAHREESVRLAVTFLEHVSGHDYPHSFMLPLLEKYQQIL